LAPFLPLWGDKFLAKIQKVGRGLGVVIDKLMKPITKW